MNKFIKHDIENALSLLKIAIHNALSDIETGEEEEIILGEFIPFSLVVEIAEERGWRPWDIDKDDLDTNGWEYDCWYDMRLPNTENKVCIASSLWKGQKTKVYIYDN